MPPALMHLKCSINPISTLNSNGLVFGRGTDTPNTIKRATVYQAGQHHYPCRHQYDNAPSPDNNAGKVNTYQDQRNQKPYGSVQFPHVLLHDFLLFDEKFFQQLCR